MSDEDILMLELYDKYNKTLEVLRDECINMEWVLTSLYEIGENVSELIAPVTVEANQLAKFCNEARSLEEIRQKQSGE